MGDNKFSDFGEGKSAFISYLDDDDKTVSGYVTLISINDFVTFRTDKNLIRISSQRVLKIKERIEND